MILIIDNYDNFVHTLARYVDELGLAYQIIRNDKINPDAVLAQKPQAVLLSPGPATPKQAGGCVALIRACRGRLPMLGICLGHQAIAQAYAESGAESGAEDEAEAGATIGRAPEPAHGIASDIYHHGHGLFHRLDNPFQAARYHSLAILKLPNGLRQIAALAGEKKREEKPLIMAVADDAAKIYGMQFHPESILTQHGHQLLSNFFTLANIPHQTKMPIRELISCG